MKYSGRICLFILVSTLLRAANVPFLVATPERVAQIQAAIADRNPHHQPAFETLVSRLKESNLGEAYDGGSAGYVDGWRAREAALAALLTPNPAQRKQFAATAFEFALKASNKNDAPISGMQRNPNELGLRSAMNGFSVALAYNWMQNEWTEDQKQQVRSKIEAGLEDWPKFRHANTTQSHDGSNWVAVTRGAELTMIYAIGDQQKRAGRVNALVGHLTNHVKNAFGDLGVGQEGAGYTEYPGVFLLPAALIDQQEGSGKIMQAIQQHDFWKMAMYTHSFQSRAFDEEDRKFLTWGVAERGHDQGWASLLIPTVPHDQLPYYLWFYDRHMGKEFTGPMDAFERHRAGTVWALLLYPPNARTADPTGIFPQMVTDSHGFAFFRNRWRDQNDIQFMAAADEKHHSNAWDQPDAFGLALLAQNSAYITGAGKETGEKTQTGILVDRKKRAGDNATTGKIAFSEPLPGGGRIRIDGGQTYRKLGLSEATRDVSVMFSAPDANLAMMSVWDQLTSSTEKTFTWQLNTGAPQSQKNVLSLQEGREAGRKTFTLSDRNGGYLKGWVMHPLDAEILPGADPLQIRTSGKESDIWVVMVTGPGTPPTARVVGEGMNGGLQVGTLRTYYNTPTDKLIIKNL